MRRTFIGAAALAATWAVLHASPAVADRQEMITLDTRPGITQNFLLVAPAQPVASLVLLEGNNGLLHISGTKVGENKGFLTSSREKFAALGFAAALLDAPSDKQTGKGMSPGFRIGKNHGKDIAAVVSWLRREYKRPVWLVGIAQGTLSAAKFAIRKNGSVDGLVLLSSMAKISKEAAKFGEGEALPDMKLERIRASTLLVAHSDDECEYGLPDTAKHIGARLTSAAGVEVRYVEGGQSLNKKDPCRDNTHHTFYAIEDRVVAAIADFVKQHTPSKPAAKAGAGAEAGAFRSEEEVLELLVGNTIQYQDNRGRTLTVFFAEDGSAMFTAGKKAFRKKWWFKEGGVLCRTVGKDNREQCSKVARDGTSDAVRFHTPDGALRYQAALLSGNRLPQ